MSVEKLEKKDSGAPLAELRWDVFIAYATGDSCLARSFFESLSGELRVFFAEESIDYGEDWDVKLAQAQDGAYLTLVLVSASTEKAFYQREELHRAIALAREFPTRHRVVPIFIDGKPHGRGPVPYGLRLKHGVDLCTTTVDKVAASLVQLVRRKAPAPDSKSEPAAAESRRELQTPQAQERFVRSEILHERLARLLRSSTHSNELKEARRELAGFLDKERRGGLLQAGDRLNGRYALLENLGAGGFGTVWRAQDLETRDEVSVKVVHPNVAADPDNLMRFRRGARLMAGLQHPAIVEVREAEGEDHGFHYAVLEFVDGGSLEALLSRKPKPLRAVIVDIVGQVADALAFAHAAPAGGVVHRDIKPDNILVRRDGTALLTDFDLALPGIRASTAALGTAAYAAPELVDQTTSGDNRTDVYSLAMTAIFALDGGGWTTELLTDPARAVDSLGCDDAMATLLRSAVSQVPLLRPPDAGVFAAAWHAAVAHPADEARDFREEAPAPIEDGSPVLWNRRRDDVAGNIASSTPGDDTTPDEEGTFNDAPTRTLLFAGGTAAVAGFLYFFVSPGCDPRPVDPGAAAGAAQYDAATSRIDAGGQRGEKGEVGDSSAKPPSGPDVVPVPKPVEGLMSRLESVRLRPAPGSGILARSVVRNKVPTFTVVVGKPAQLQAWDGDVDVTREFGWHSKSKDVSVAAGEIQVSRVMWSAVRTKLKGVPGPWARIEAVSDLGPLRFEPVHQCITTNDGGFQVNGRLTGCKSHLSRLDPSGGTRRGLLAPPFPLDAPFKGSKNARLVLDLDSVEASNEQQPWLGVHLADERGRVTHSVVLGASGDCGVWDHRTGAAVWVGGRPVTCPDGAGKHSFWIDFHDREAAGESSVGLFADGTRHVDQTGIPTTSLHSILFFVSAGVRASGSVQFFRIASKS